MKPKNLFVICTLCVIFLLVGTSSSLSFYQSSSSSMITSIWNNSKSIGKFNDSSDEISFSSIPVVVVYKSKKVGDVQSPNPVIIDISDKDFGALWIPIIKDSDYNFMVPCSLGEIYVSGQYSIIGLCPSKIATNLVVDKVMKDIYAEAKKHKK